MIAYNLNEDSLHVCIVWFLLSAAGLTHAIGQLIAIDYSDSTSDVAFAYDRLGRQLTVTDVLGTRTNVYELRGQTPKFRSPEIVVVDMDNRIVGVKGGCVSPRAAAGGDNRPRPSRDLHVIIHGRNNKETRGQSNQMLTVWGLMGNENQWNGGFLPQFPFDYLIA
jgi:hypothetical protein